MKYAPRGIEFQSLPDRTVNAKASELQGLDFIQVVSLFRNRINEAFGVSQ